MARAGASAGEQAARQRRHAAADRAIVPERLVLPDLRSRASIDAADRRYAARQARD
ncbi:hypothetical protein [Vallicoccus soli]|uniref:hypothetical protein n=1 Tax=Vallicoccus soli TaxID=2339232 RepID=UPI001402AF18|nr:hypothetical protein [Vallicoccus soli]